MEGGEGSDGVFRWGMVGWIGGIIKVGIIFWDDIKFDAKLYGHVLRHFR